MLSENQIFLHGAINKAGKKTPINLLKMQEKRTAAINVNENLPDSIEYIESPRYVKTNASAACPMVSMARTEPILL